MFFVIWVGVIKIFKVNPFILPDPVSVVESFKTNSIELLQAMWVTTLIALSGLLLSFLIGCSVALIMSQSKVIEMSLFPYAILLQSIPIVAIAPIIILWFGAGFESMVVIAFIISLFPIITNVVVGLTKIEKSYFELFSIYKASKIQILFFLRIPFAVSMLITGLKISAGLSVVGAIVGEYFTGLAGQAFGLAYLIQSTQQHADYPYMYATCFAAAILGFFIFISVSLLGNWVIKKGHFNHESN